MDEFVGVLLADADPEVRVAVMSRPVSQVALDGSYDISQGFVAYGGIAGRQRPILQYLDVEWKKLLAVNGLTSLHFRDAMSFRGDFRKLADDWGDNRERERNALLMKFADLCCVSGELGPIAHAGDLRGLTGKSIQAKKVSLFQRVIADQVLARIPTEDDHVVLICDEEQDVDDDFLRWLKNLKQRNPRARRQIAGICFVDDEVVTAVQAADMVAYLMREEYERRCLRASDPMNPLMARLMSRANQFSAEDPSS